MRGSRGRIILRRRLWKSVWVRGLNSVLASSARRGHHWQDEGIGMLDDCVFKVRWDTSDVISG
jgi:hypothetical protein